MTYDEMKQAIAERLSPHVVDANGIADRAATHDLIGAAIGEALNRAYTRGRQDQLRASAEIDEALKKAAVTPDKAAAWKAFTDAVIRWNSGIKINPDNMRALADAACEYAGHRVARHVAEAYERCAVIAERERYDDSGDVVGSYRDACDDIAVSIRAAAAEVKP